MLAFHIVITLVSKNVRKIGEHPKYFLIFATTNTDGMQIVFQKEYLSELYYEGKSSDKKHRFQPDIVKRYTHVINTLISANRIEDLFPLRSLNYEVLEGNLKGYESVRVNDKYRVLFRSEKVESDAIITVCNIEELTNHYK